MAYSKAPYPRDKEEDMEKQDVALRKKTPRILLLLREGKYTQIEREHGEFLLDKKEYLPYLAQLMADYEMLVYHHDLRGGFMAGLMPGKWVLWNSLRQKVPGDDINEWTFEKLSQWGTSLWQGKGCSWFRIIRLFKPHPVLRESAVRNFTTFLLAENLIANPDCER